MQDLHGFNEVALAAVRAFDHGGRSTGRTARMLAQLKPGHRIICATSREADRLRRLLRDHGLRHEVEIATWDPQRDMPHGLRSALPAPTVADHHWVYLHFIDAIHREAEAIRREIAGLSGRELGLPEWPELPAAPRHTPAPSWLAKDI